ncbi:stimulus-sensing domain-containing protein [Methylocella sp.]|uniref:stimulus-sensing domain-containing protein n=1 Tax=Methylocella sp. TaxID=1978226 RepID=UPI0037851A63
MTLDLRQDVEFDRKEVAARRAKRMRRSFSARLRGVLRAFISRFSSSLTRRIVVLNLGGLLALLVGFLYLNQFREGLIDARIQSLQTQAEIIAASIAASATADTDAIAIDPEKLLQLAPGESYRLSDDTAPFEFSINPERVGPVLRRLVSPTRTRARIYDRDGYLLLDSRSLTSRANILRFDLPAPTLGESASLAERLWARMKNLIWRTGLPPYEENALDNGNVYPEVTRALAGSAQAVARINDKGETIVSVAAPIQRFHTVRGAVLLSTMGGDIDAIIASERWAITRVFLVSAVIMFALSMFIAGTIAEPIRKLAEAAERVRRRTKLRSEIPDLTSRADEIGHLSRALRDMTGALYSRIAAIESFAADVAHELKNPLTSLRSAVETLPNVKKPESRERLLEVIQHDVKRLDRLISDISDASRLDAELARADMESVDLERVLKTVIDVASQVKNGNDVHVSFTVARGRHHDRGKSSFCVLGHDSRLGQVFNNLIDNARSFSCPGGWVRVHLRPAEDCADDGQWRDGFEITVDDDGPGVPADAFERIFERFYTDRPCQGFGQNSGLGLSISRQIVEAHGGRISAMNRLGPPTDEDEEPPVLGARLVVFLPRA